ncbi:hypothetical protein JG687_00001624 [Phytophthora cactorum]|uniref:Uncharacterized protein n=1 Tax=Phytophthora cactorum TaxID=29920 RepID=A0A8T1V0J0_9STRA|nr:hypothetical protein JG687_00001624 [Phytophthora cactorum]
MASSMSAIFKIDVNWLRGVYIAMFFCNAIFATMFKTIGRGLLTSFGTFSDCDATDSEFCQGNQMIFRTSFSISMFFLTRALLSRFGWVQPRRRAIKILIWVEIPVLIALLVGSFYIPSTFFDGYVPFTRVASGFFILFQIFSIVSVSSLVSNPDKTCEHRDHPPPTPEDEEAANTNSMIANAVIAAFAMTWTSWRTSSAAAKLLVRRAQGLYMAMVLTDWDSADGSFNAVSMWVKIVAQWITILLFSWTLIAPKLFPDRDFS